jgi:quercetin dioxygenase-like cupin family protein
MWTKANWDVFLMENPMRRFTLLLFVALLGAVDRLAAQEHVEIRGIASEIKLDEIVYGHMTEINGRFKMRATEVTFAPGGFLGVYHHVGPGIRYVISGAVTFTEAGQSTIYKAGEYFFETGNLAHTAENKTNEPLRILFVEILPKDWSASTVIPPKP